MPGLRVRHVTPALHHVRGSSANRLRYRRSQRNQLEISGNMRFSVVTAEDRP